MAGYQAVCVVGAHRLTAPIQSSVKYRVLKLVELHTADGTHVAGQFPPLPLSPPPLSSPNLLLLLVAVPFQSTCSKYPVSSLKNNFVEKACMKNVDKIRTIEGKDVALITFRINVVILTCYM